jgi:hypothetical protein
LIGENPLTKIRIIDPEEQRYKRRFPKFPGVSQCVLLLESSNVHGSFLNAVIGDLTENAQGFLTEIIIAFYLETDQRVKRILIAAIAESAPVDAVGFLAENLNSTDDSICDWAIRGLERIDTKEARTALWLLKGSKE